MLTLSLLFLALLFILGLITTLFNFPSKKLNSWIYSIYVKSSSSSSSSSSSESMAEQKVKTTSSVTRSSSSSISSNKLDLTSIFATFDKNNDGYITKQELKQSLNNIGIFMDDSDIVEMVEKVDSNKDGLIDLGEFYELCHSYLGVERGVTEGGNGGGEASNNNNNNNQEDDEENRERDLKDAFDVFDNDKDGLISEEELSEVLKSLGLKHGKRLDDCKEMIRKVDVDGDGMVNFDEFKEMMKNGGRLIQIS